MYKLIIEDDEGHTTIVPLVKDEITIGRKEGNTIRLTERNVSRHHARLLRSNGSFSIEDLDSYNGVRVNGDRITTRTTIREGDLVEIGDYHLALQRVAEKETSGPPSIPQESRATPAPAQLDGATALLKLPVDQKPLAEKGRVRVIPDDQAARLEVMTTDLQGRQFLLNRTEMTIGRTDESDIVIAHRSVSAVHAKIVYDGGVYRILDLDSANGVLVNGEEYVRVDLRRGDVIELGHVKMRFIAPGEKAMTQAAPVSATEEPKRVFGEAPLLERRPAAGRKWFWLAGPAVVAVALGLFFVLRPREPEKIAGEGREPNVTAPAVENSSAVDTAELYREGMSRFSQGDIPGALAKLEALQTVNPEHPGLQPLLEKVRRAEQDVRLVAQARAAMDQQDWDRAYDLFKQLDPEGAQAREVEQERNEVRKKAIMNHLNRARKALENKDTLEIVDREAKKVKEIDPGNSQADELMNRAARLRKKPAVAEAHAQPTPGTAGRKPVVRDAWAAAGVTIESVKSAMKIKNYRQAIVDLDRVLKNNPRECEALIWMGAAYASSQQRTQAAKYYQQFVDDCPTDKRLPQVRGILKKFEETINK